MLVNISIVIAQIGSVIGGAPMVYNCVATHQNILRIAEYLSILMRRVQGGLSFSTGC